MSDELILEVDNEWLPSFHRATPGPRKSENGHVNKLKVKSRTHASLGLSIEGKTVPV
jgi:hypothetical protein